MKPTFLLAAALLLPCLYGPAQAAQTYSRAITTDLDTQVLDEGFDLQPSAASSTSAAVGDIVARARTDFGVVKLFADAPATPGHAGLSQAFGSFSDTLSFSGGTDPIPYSFSFVANGVALNHTPGAGDWAYDLEMSLTGEFVSGGAVAKATTSDTGAVTIAASFNGFMIPNKPVDLFVYFAIFTSGNEFSAFQLDFSHTAVLTSFGVPAGTVVTSAALGVLPSAGGAANYPAALQELSAVPEPNGRVLLASGLALLLGAARVRRRG